MADNSTEKATFAGGCFWCIEAVFRRVKGVVDVQSGYTGGTDEHPTYDSVSVGGTGHVEAVQVTFDPAIVSYEELLSIFFSVHNPTTWNQQGADVGEQYRSVIFFHSDDQKYATHELIREINDSQQFNAPVVTEVRPSVEFYPAESYHDAYYEKNRTVPYSQAVIDPKIEKLKKTFSHLVVDTEKGST